MEHIFTTDFWLFALNKMVRIAAILGVTFVFLRSVRLVVDRVLTPRMGSKALYFEEKRVKTLSGLLQSIIRYAVYFVAFIMILQEFKIDTTSMIAGAGVIGLALGVGAQSLIKDFITGFFIILEDQYSVGDYIASGDMAGTVEAIGFRVTKLRDANGVLHILPNGSISRVSNFTRGHMQAVINIPVAYQSDLTVVFDILNQACADVRKNMPEVIEGPVILGVVDFRPGAVLIRMVAKTVPLEQVRVETALRRTAKEMLDAAHIPPPPVSMGM